MTIIDAQKCSCCDASGKVCDACGRNQNNERKDSGGFRKCTAKWEAPTEHKWITCQKCGGAGIVKKG